jgi:antitoxin PrlF
MSKLSEIMGFFPKVEAVVSVDDKGQIVLPKEVRTKAKINAGDKLVLGSLTKSGETIFLMMLKSELFAEHFKEALGPVMKDMKDLMK